MNNLELKIELLKICVEKGLNVDFDERNEAIIVSHFNSEKQDFYFYERNSISIESLIQKAKDYEKNI